MRSLTSRGTLDELIQLFARHGWRDRDGAADAMLLAIAADPDRRVVPENLASVVPGDFNERNDISREDVAIAVRDALNDIQLSPEPADTELVPIDEIDSFASVRDVKPEDVEAFAAPLQINERVIKHCVHACIGDPYIDEDWGGERSDVASGRVELAGARITSAFLLKGRSVQGPLYGSDLGTRGDQIVRLLEVRAGLSIVQHVNQIPSETQDQLRYGVLALRTMGVQKALGSIWDGVDTARLMLSSGYIDSNGVLTKLGRDANDELKRS